MTVRTHSYSQSYVAHSWRLYSAVLLGLFVCCCFMSYQHLSSYQDGYWVMTVCTHSYSHSYVIVLFHWETRTPAPWPNIPHIHVIFIQAAPTSSCPLVVSSSAKLGSDKYTFDKSLLWLVWDSNSRPSWYDLRCCQILKLHQPTNSDFPPREACVQPFLIPWCIFCTSPPPHTFPLVKVSQWSLYSWSWGDSSVG